MEVSLRHRSHVFGVLTALAVVTAAPAHALPVPAQDHVIVVVMENMSYSEAIVLPYIASLTTIGAKFTDFHAVAHPSQPNYFAMWAGNTIVSNDNCPAAGSPYPYANIGNSLQNAGKTWRSYAENLPVVGGTACSYDGSASTGLYTRKHCPWTYFNNVNHTSERPYSDLAVDIAANQLPNLAFVIPNNCHNAHNSSTVGCSRANADTWLSQNLPAMINAVGPNGFVVLTWDEDDSTEGNRIMTIMIGPHVIPGASSARTVYHYTMLRTIGDALGIPPVGGAFNEAPITDVWQVPVAARHESWGALKIRYR